MPCVFGSVVITILIQLVQSVHLSWTGVTTNDMPCRADPVMTRAFLSEEDLELEDPNTVDGKKAEDGGTESELEDSIFFNEDLLCELHGQSARFCVNYTVSQLGSV